MTTTITNDLGEFKADTEKEALALVRSAKQKAAKQKKIDDANLKLAVDERNRIEAMVYRRFVEGEPGRSWKFHPAGTEGAAKSERDGYGGVKVTIRQANAVVPSGCFHWETFNDTYIGSIDNISGDLIIAVESGLYVFGVVADQASWTKLPDAITVDWFPVSKHAEGGE